MQTPIVQSKVFGGRKKGGAEHENGGGGVAKSIPPLVNLKPELTCIMNKQGESR